MKLGTVVYDNKIYNLDYMTTDELNELQKKIDESKSSIFKEAKSLINNKK